MYKVRLLDNKEVSQNTFLAKMEKPFSFRAGQVIGVKLKEEDAPRLYSIVSGEGDEYIEILYHVKEGGYLTPLLSRMRQGEEILISDPQGNFLCRAKDVFWVATGTGVAPFVSMLRSGFIGDVFLLYGVKKEEHLCFNGFLHEKLGVNYLPCLSKEGIQKDFFCGRVTDWLLNNTFSKNKMFFLCGSAEMVVEVRDILVQKGIDYKNIISEIYF